MKRRINSLGRPARNLPRIAREVRPAGGDLPNRSGALLLELIISGVLLAVAMSAVIPTLGWIARDRQVNRQRQAAMLAAGI